MSSSPTEADGSRGRPSAAAEGIGTAYAPEADPAGGPHPEGIAPDGIASGRPRGILKRALPRSLFGRSILIIVTPLILLQVIATWIFYERHWDTVARRLSGSVAGDIALVISAMSELTPEQRDRLFFTTPGMTELDFVYREGKTLADYPPIPGPREGPLVAALNERVQRPFRADLESDPRRFSVAVQLPDGVLEVAVPRQRLYSSTTYIFVLWMVGSSVVLFAVATIFMRNQVRALRRLADAAESFGKGRNVDRFKPEGATEIRQAAAAFLVMRDRIQRQIRQRTEMLAGVSHDLRTPLTRMKLALALLEDNHAVDELRSDVAEMEKMVQAYLDFARGEGTEAAVESDLTIVIDEAVATARRDGASVSLAMPGECPMLMRPNALRRCIANLLSNARRHGSHIWLTVVPAEGAVDITIDDDGPGIPAEQREQVFRAFFRLDRSRNPATGGVGLGLTIARDVARSHGGDLSLETSPQGGLRARLHLPI